MPADLLVLRCIKCPAVQNITDLDAPRISRVRRRAVELGWRDVGTQAKRDEWMCQECYKEGK